MAADPILLRMDKVLSKLKPGGSLFRQRNERSQSPQPGAPAAPAAEEQFPVIRFHQPVSGMGDEEEQLQLAMAISAAEADAAASNRANSFSRGHAPVPTTPRHSRQRSLATVPPEATASDELLARHLQEQLDLEQARGAAPADPQLPAPSAPRSAEPPAPSAPDWVPAAAPIAAPSAGPEQPFLPPDRTSQGAVPPPLLGGALAVPPVDPNACGGCGKAVRLWHQPFATAAGRKWHTWCLQCAHCQQPIQAGGGTQFALGEDGRMYHVECHKEAFHPRCDVCACFLAAQQDGLIRFHHAPFWGLRFCPHHETDGTPRCLACNRLQPHKEQWVQMDDKRFTCLSCLHTLVRNTADAQPLYEDVLHFYASMSMPLPVRPPLMLVESSALNEAEDRERGHKHDGPVFHTRGLTLSEEHRSIRTVVGSRQEGGGLLRAVPQLTAVTSSHCEVTAILVLFGLPWLLTGSILAHETMHAWLRLSGVSHLSADVEEGLAQLMALLWLEHQAPQPGSYEERLASYLAQQIRADPTPVYGEGFRAAHEAFQLNGLPRVLDQVRRTGKLPL